MIPQLCIMPPPLGGYTVVNQNTSGRLWNHEHITTKRHTLSAKWLTMSVPEVSVGPQPVPTAKCGTWEATGVAALQHRGVERWKKKRETVNLFYAMEWKSYCLPDRTESLQGSSDYIIIGAQRVRSWQVRGRAMQRQKEVEDKFSPICHFIKKKRKRQSKRSMAKIFSSEGGGVQMACVSCASPSTQANSSFKYDILSTRVQCKNHCHIPLNIGLNRSCQYLFFHLMSH